MGVQWPGAVALRVHVERCLVVPELEHDQLIREYRKFKATFPVASSSGPPSGYPPRQRRSKAGHRYPGSPATLRPLVFGQRLGGIVVDADLTHHLMWFQPARLAVWNQVSYWLAMVAIRTFSPFSSTSASSAESFVFASWMLTTFIEFSFCLCKLSLFSSFLQAAD